MFTWTRKNGLLMTTFTIKNIYCLFISIYLEGFFLI
jgi:hypothetical protein